MIASRLWEVGDANKCLQYNGCFSRDSIFWNPYWRSVIVTFHSLHEDHVCMTWRFQNGPSLRYKRKFSLKTINPELLQEILNRYREPEQTSRRPKTTNKINELSKIRASLTSRRKKWKSSETERNRNKNWIIYKKFDRKPLCYSYTTNHSPTNHTIVSHQ